MSEPVTSPSQTAAAESGESRWPMAIAVLISGLLRMALPAQLRTRDSRWAMLVVIIILLGIVIILDPGRIDRESRWLHLTTRTLIGLITIVNAFSAARLVGDIVNGVNFTNNARTLLLAGGAIWLTNVIAFALWYWDLDRGGAAARARGSTVGPAFIFPEMVNDQFVRENWYPKFIDYLHFSFATATAFSPTDVSAIKAWAKSLMICEELISLLVALLVIARAVNIIK